MRRHNRIPTRVIIDRLLRRCWYRLSEPAADRLWRTMARRLARR
jgi:hypothetical protein